MIAARKGTEPGLQTHSGPIDILVTVRIGVLGAWLVKDHRVFRFPIVGGRKLAGVDSALSLQGNRCQVVGRIDHLMAS